MGIIGSLFSFLPLIFYGKIPQNPSTNPWGFVSVRLFFMAKSHKIHLQTLFFAHITPNITKSITTVGIYS